VDYDKDEILQKCIKAIEDHKCTTFDEMSLYVAPTRQTLYNWGFDKFDIIKEAICQQKIIAKSRMKKNWQSEEAAPALQIAAFKLMADDDELEKLVINKSDVKANVSGEMKVLEINVNGFTEQSSISDKDSV
jgi:hypothetical protein